MGPDEYHDRYPHSDQPGLHNNAYTNLMTVWVLRTALEILDLLPKDCRRELGTQLNLGSEELDRWRAITRKMRLVFHDQGIISQFEGYGALQEFDWERYREKYGDIQGGTTPEGIHLGAMAGTVELVQRCYSGIETRGDVLWFNPSLPDELTELHFDIRFRGHSLAVDISRDTLTVSSNRCREIPALIGFGNERFELEAGNRLEFKIED
ncbi:MAG: hypothetical protein K9K79_13665 [Desulfohalobiaceae bacterium]|nr:hypothetical protein [Desulfohalobiaceae bacterium]